MTTLASATVVVIGGVDTHADVHVAAACDQLGGVLGTAAFPTTPAGYRVAAAVSGRSFGPLVGRGGRHRLIRVRAGPAPGRGRGGRWWR